MTEKLIPSLGSDNHSGVHPQIFQALLATQVGHAPSYGNDPWTEELRTQFKALFGKSCEAFLVFNGTAANILCLDSLVQSHEAVVCSDIAHLHMDECGAPEKNVGCKIIPVPSNHGKITVADIKKVLIRRGDQHASQIKAVSLTQPTEYGTFYSLKELQEIREFTRSEGLKLHLDGARFIYNPEALKCQFIDLGEKLGVDAISFGGTKNGLLFGEACLIFNEESKERFKYRRKQMMQLPSKQRFIAAQFLRLFENELWREISKHGHKMAKYLEERLKDIEEIEITQPVQANVVFAKLPKNWVKELRKQFFFYVWDETNFECRLMISFDVSKTMIDDFVEAIQKLRPINKS